MRELRVLGWDYTTSQRKEHARMMSYYRLTKFTDWPEGSISTEISRREKTKEASR